MPFGRGGGEGLLGSVAQGVLAVPPPNMERQLMPPPKPPFFRAPESRRLRVLRAW